MTSITSNYATTLLRNRILGHAGQVFEEILETVAANLGVLHISYIRLSTDKDSDIDLVCELSTYPVQWKTRYFERQYELIDPIIFFGSKAILPFDWDQLTSDDPANRAFFDDMALHKIGRNGISVPVRNRMKALSLVSYTSNHSKNEWLEYKKQNIKELNLLSNLIDSAANIDLKLPDRAVQLSKREEECLIWAARGKSYQDIARILNLTVGGVKSHLDTARHKLNCIDLNDAIAVAVATEAIPAILLR